MRVDERGEERADEEAATAMVGSGLPKRGQAKRRGERRGEERAEDERTRRGDKERWMRRRREGERRGHTQFTIANY